MQAALGRLTGFKDDYAAQRLRYVPATRWIVGRRVGVGMRGGGEPDWLRRAVDGAKMKILTLA
jgi:hypothetical protein